MSKTVTYWKPNMAAMPNDIGLRVIAEIMNSKPADQAVIHERNLKVRENIRQSWEQEAKRDITQIIIPAKGDATECLNQPESN